MVLLLDIYPSSYTYSDIWENSRGGKQSQSSLSKPRCSFASTILTLLNRAWFLSSSLHLSKKTVISTSGNFASCMANSLLMVEIPPLLEPHSEAKMVTLNLLKPPASSCSWESFDVDAIASRHVQHSLKCIFRSVLSPKKNFKHILSCNHTSFLQLTILCRYQCLDGKGKGVRP